MSWIVEPRDPRTQSIGVEPGYDATVETKRRLCEEHGIELVLLDPRDLLSVDRLTGRLLAITDGSAVGAVASDA